ncbi:helix-turn-helix domain-containing protein [Streptomyces gilvifuscus]|uniref:Helix-turn-helix domain-containing protein n=1 Tax=Streptomyces gilvifuscus TaxID=1550617 RepID=A0ABT5G640_9ACTN|nr:helix-turn-helix domain-containing protein [Streptomyces gilvifuscus]MDC2960293.1 helix-turn-helix domain-containing protein [Streptomyces gilvifuscus]
MLRIHFGPEDFARIRLTRAPDPLWEIVGSLHRFQTTRGRWAYADWYRSAREALVGRGLDAAVRRLLIPVLPRARYFPDFLTPLESSDGLERGLEAIRDAPPARVAREVQRLDEVNGAPGWAGRLPERHTRDEFVKLLGAYHEAVIAPHHDRICARLAGEHALRARQTLDAGIDGLLDDLTPAVRWEPPVLRIDYVEDRDIHLRGRGLRLIPSYFCWQMPVTLVDDSLQPVLVYPVHRSRLPASEAPSDASLVALLGRTRAAALRALALGATTSELARSLGVSPATVTHHTSVLRDAGLTTSRRHRNTVLHTLTPLGAAVLRPGFQPGGRRASAVPDGPAPSRSSQQPHR